MSDVTDLKQFAYHLAALLRPATRDQSVISSRADTLFLVIQEKLQLRILDEMPDDGFSELGRLIEGRAGFEAVVAHARKSIPHFAKLVVEVLREMQAEYPSYS